MKVFHEFSWRAITLTFKQAKIHKKHFKIENVLTFWRLKASSNFWTMRNPTIEVKVTIFKASEVSKIIHLALVIKIPITVIRETRYKKNRFGSVKILK